MRFIATDNYQVCTSSWYILLVHLSKYIQFNTKKYSFVSLDNTWGRVAKKRAGSGLKVEVFRLKGVTHLKGCQQKGVA